MNFHEIIAPIWAAAYLKNDKSAINKKSPPTRSKDLP